jgi:cytochrome c oxidase cbb3-type subunit I
MQEQTRPVVPVSGGAGAAPAMAPLVHEDTTAKWFLVSSVAYFFIVGIIAIMIAAKFVWPEMLGTV